MCICSKSKDITQSSNLSGLCASSLVKKKLNQHTQQRKKKRSSRCERLNKKPLFPNSKSCSRQIFMLFILRLTELAHELLQIPNFSLFSHGVYLLWIKLNLLAIISRRSLKYLWFLLHVCVCLAVRLKRASSMIHRLWRVTTLLVALTFDLCDLSIPGLHISASRRWTL